MQTEKREAEEICKLHNGGEEGPGLQLLHNFPDLTSFDIFRVIGYGFRDNPLPDWVMNHFKEDIDSYNEISSALTN